jgi:hypothetical protein
MLGLACCRASSSQLARWLNVSRLARGPRGVRGAPGERRAEGPGAFGDAPAAGPCCMLVQVFFHIARISTVCEPGASTLILAFSRNGASAARFACERARQQQQRPPPPCGRFQPVSTPAAPARGCKLRRARPRLGHGCAAASLRCCASGRQLHKQRKTPQTRSPVAPAARAAPSLPSAHRVMSYTSSAPAAPR